MFIIIYNFSKVNFVTECFVNLKTWCISFSKGRLIVFHSNLHCCILWVQYSRTCQLNSLVNTYTAVSCECRTAELASWTALSIFTLLYPVSAGQQNLPAEQPCQYLHCCILWVQDSRTCQLNSLVNIYTAVSCECRTAELASWTALSIFTLLYPVSAGQQNLPAEQPYQYLHCCILWVQDSRTCQLNSLVNTYTAVSCECRTAELASWTALSIFTLLYPVSAGQQNLPADQPCQYLHCCILWVQDSRTCQLNSLVNTYTAVSCECKTAELARWQPCQYLHCCILWVQDSRTCQLISLVNTYTAVSCECRTAELASWTALSILTLLYPVSAGQQNLPTEQPCQYLHCCILWVQDSRTCQLKKPCQYLHCCILWAQDSRTCQLNSLVNTYTAVSCECRTAELASWTALSILTLLYPVSAGQQNLPAEQPCQYLHCCILWVQDSRTCQLNSLVNTYTAVSCECRTAELASWTALSILTLLYPVSAGQQKLPAEQPCQYLHCCILWVQDSRTCQLNSLVNTYTAVSCECRTAELASWTALSVSFPAIHVVIQRLISCSISVLSVAANCSKSASFPDYKLIYMSRDMTKPTMWLCAQRRQISLGISPVWSESSLSTWRKLGSLATHWAHSEDSDQTGRMPRLIWVFTGRTLILLVLLWCGSHTAKLLNWKIAAIILRRLSWSFTQFSFNPHFCTNKFEWPYTEEFEI